MPDGKHAEKVQRECLIRCCLRPSLASGLIDMQFSLEISIGCLENVSPNEPAQPQHVREQGGSVLHGATSHMAEAVDSVPMGALLPRGCQC